MIDKLQLGQVEFEADNDNQIAQTGTKKEKGAWMEEHKKKKRRMMDFAEFSDWALAKGITNEEEFGHHAGEEKQNGNTTLWNYGGSQQVACQIQKCVKGFACRNLTANVFRSASKSTSQYPLDRRN